MIKGGVLKNRILKSIKSMSLDKILILLLKLLLPVVVFGLTFNQLNNYVFNKLLIDNYAPLAISEILFLIIVLIIFTGIIYRGVKFQYRQSYGQLYFSYIIIVVLGFTYFLPHKEWEFLNIKILEFWGVSYVFIIGCFVLFNLSLGIGIIAFQYLKRLFKKEGNVNYLINDEPLTSDGTDLIDYSDSIASLENLISNSSFSGSFSVGIIGQWGSGKSSFSNLFKKRVSNKDAIQIEFSPFLVRDKINIVKSFFNNLSEILSNYDGNISNQLDTYVNKLLAIYDNGKLGDILRINDLNDKEFKEVYDSIKKTLISVDKKIIVYIDDLDRLDEDEIIEVLKLLRNSVNFPNVFFIVEMDKEYVLNKLSSNKKELDYNFIDKFFQLEVSIPEISKSKLSLYFTNEVSKSIALSKTIKELILLNIDNDKFLFDFYINNFRDVKRFLNQILFESNFLEEEVEIIDLLNFIFFKIKFPHVIKILNSNKDEFFNFENGNYVLKKEGGGPKTFDYLLQMGGSFRSRFYIRYEDYSLFKDIFDPENNNVLSLNLSHIEKKLLLKTLIHLFGTENKVETSTSIKSPNNFRKLMEQKISKDDLPVKDFNRLIVDGLSEGELNSYSDSKIENLLSHIDYFLPKNEVDLNNVLFLLFNIWGKVKQEGSFESNAERLIFKFIRTNISNEQLLLSFINNNIIINNVEISNYKKLIFLVSLKNQEDLFKNIYKDDNVYDEILNSALDDSLDELKGLEWQINDYTFFRVSEYARSIILDEQIAQNKILDFLSNLDTKKIQIFITQLLDNYMRDESMFAISNVTANFFGSKDKLVEFVNNHNISKVKEMNRVISFLKLQKIINFSRYLIFDFGEENKYFNQRYSKDFESNSMLCQILLRTNDSSLASEISMNLGYQSFIHSYEGESYLLLPRDNVPDYHSFLKDITKDVKKRIDEGIFTDYQLNENVVNENDTILINSKGDKYLKFYYGASAFNGRTSFIS